MLNTHVPAAGGAMPTVFIPFTPDLRRRLDATISALIDLADSLDADPDIEDGADDEPTIGAPEKHPSAGWGSSSWGEYRDASGSQMRWADGGGAPDECEEGADDDQSEEGGGDDINDQPEGEDADSENSLGWHGEIDQSDLSRGADIGVLVQDGEIGVDDVQPRETKLPPLDEAVRKIADGWQWNGHLWFKLHQPEPPIPADVLAGGERAIVLHRLRGRVGAVRL